MFRRSLSPLLAVIVSSKALAIILTLYAALEVAIQIQYASSICREYLAGYQSYIAKQRAESRVVSSTLDERGRQSRPRHLSLTRCQIQSYREAVYTEVPKRRQKSLVRRLLRCEQEGRCLYLRPLYRYLYLLYPAYSLYRRYVDPSSQ